MTEAAALIERPVGRDAMAWGDPVVSKVRFRGIRAADFGILHSFAHHLSPETGYKRLLSPRLTMRLSRCCSA